MTPYPAPSEPDFTVCVLLYGDYPQLARRCLESLTVLPAERVQFRIAANEISPATESLLSDYLVALDPAHVYRSRVNLHKYPVMRQMLHGQQAPVTTPYVMWFDDDSYLDIQTVSANEWLEQVARLLDTHAMVGSLYSQAFQGNQREWLQAQPWYGGKSPARRQVLFCQGGWWTARLSALQQLGYPWPELDHRGGDVMLGEAMFQQGLSLGRFRDGVHINADELGRESKSKRRGFDSAPVGYTYRSDVIADTIGPALQRAVSGAPPPLRSKYLKLDI